MEVLYLHLHGMSEILVVPKTGPESEELMGRQFIFVNARFLPVGFNQFPNRSGALKVVLYFINCKALICPNYRVHICDKYFPILHGTTCAIGGVFGDGFA